MEAEENLGGIALLINSEAKNLLFASTFSIERKIVLFGEENNLHVILIVECEKLSFTFNAA